MKTSIMKNFKNTFIPVVIFIIILIIGFQIIKTYSYSNNDTNSYVELIRGVASINAQDLQVGDSKKVTAGDILQVGDLSLAVISWGDGSLTRVGENSELEIRKNSVSDDLGLIDISFHLLSGKSWSKVVSFINKDSSFTQSFDDVEAGVRGTVFDVDLTKDFLRVSDHEITLKTTTGNTIKLSEGEILDTERFELIDIVEFISQIEDSAWTEINKNFDIEYIRKMSQNLQENLEIQNPFLFILEYFSPTYRLIYSLDIADDFKEVQDRLDKIPAKKYSKIYDSIFTRYQKMNFVNANNYEYYKRKIFYKKALVFLAETTEVKEDLLRTSAYDLQDILRSEDAQGLEETLNFLNDNKDIIEDLDLSFLQSSFDFIPEGLRNTFSENFNELFNAIPDFNGMNIEDITNTAKEKINGIDEGIKNFLDTNASGLIEKFKK